MNYYSHTKVDGTAFFFAFDLILYEPALDSFRFFIWTVSGNRPFFFKYYSLYNLKTLNHIHYICSIDGWNSINDLHIPFFVFFLSFFCIRNF